MSIPNLAERVSELIEHLDRVIKLVETHSRGHSAYYWARGYLEIAERDAAADPDSDVVIRGLNEALSNLRCALSVALDACEEASGPLGDVRSTLDVLNMVRILRDSLAF